MANATLLAEGLTTFSGYPNTFGVIAGNVGTVLLAFQFLFFGLRIYTKAFVVHSLHWDDCKLTLI
jgi:hypothetical protein